jgi:hypothetical protein
MSSVTPAAAREGLSTFAVDVAANTIGREGATRFKAVTRSSAFAVGAWGRRLRGRALPVDKTDVARRIFELHRSLPWMIDGEILPVWNYSIASMSNYEVTLAAERPKIDSDSLSPQNH